MSAPLDRASTAPAAITGIGAVSGCGFGVESLWRGLLAGESAVRPIERFDHRPHRTHQAAEVPLRSGEPSTPRGASWSCALRHASLCDRFALLAAAEALAQARLTVGGSPAGPVRASRIGVYFGSSTGGMLEAEQWFAAARVGHGRASITPMAAQQTSAPGEAIARAVLATGPVFTISSACASATLAFGSALDALRLGEVDIALAGGADSLCQLTYAGFNSLRSVDPEATRPFRAGRVGLSLGEGAAVLVLESVGHATARGAQPLALLSGAGGSCDAHHMTAPDPSGSGAARAIGAALRSSGLDPAQIDFVNAHATGTPHNDVAEWHALRQVFGPRAALLPIVATKGTVGHFLGSAGAIEAIATVLCLRHRTLHPTPAGGEIDPETPVDLVMGEPRPLPGARHALSTNLAFGGSNAAIVLSRAEAS